MDQRVQSLVFIMMITFKSSHTSITNDASSGCPSVSSADENTECVHFTIKNNWQVTADKVAHRQYISHSTVHEIIPNRLGFNKVCVIWVPKQLKKEDKSNQWQSAEACCITTATKLEAFLTCTVTRKETRILHMSQRESTRVWTVNIWHHQSKRSSKQSHQQGKWCWYFSWAHKDKSWNTMKGGAQQYTVYVTAGSSRIRWD